MEACDEGMGSVLGFVEYVFGWGGLWPPGVDDASLVVVRFCIVEVTMEY